VVVAVVVDTVPDVAVSVEITTQVQIHASIDKFRLQSACWHQDGSQVVVDNVTVDGHEHGHKCEYEAKAQSTANSHQKGSQVVMEAEVEVDAVVVDLVPEDVVLSEVDVAVVAVVLDTVRDDIDEVSLVEIRTQAQMQSSTE